MTEPGAGSDLAGIRTSAVRDGDDWIINGAKTFISSGINCDLCVVVARTDPEAGHKGFTLFVVERGMEGFTRGRKLDKMGLHSQDTSELNFENVRVPGANLLGKEGRGFYHLMTNLPSERLSIAISAIYGARAVFQETLQYAKDRKAFGQPIGSFQHNRFLLAEMETELEVTETYIDRCLQGVVDGELTAVEAAKAKWWATEVAKKVIDNWRAAARRLRLHDGVPGRPRLRGRTYPDDLRWHHRDHEGNHRARARRLVLASRRKTVPFHVKRTVLCLLTGLSTGLEDKWWRLADCPQTITGMTLDEVFALNNGVATTNQLLAVMTYRTLARRVRAGEIVRLWHGVYSWGPPDTTRRLRALDLVSGVPIVGCLGTAAQFYGFDTENTVRTHILDPGVRMRPSPDLMVHQRIGAPLKKIDGRLLTAPAWTAIELARTLRRPRALATPSTPRCAPALALGWNSSMPSRISTAAAAW